MGIVMIDAEEYRKLILAEDDKNNLLDEFADTEAQLRYTSECLKELLLFLTDGKEATEWQDKKLQSFDIAGQGKIAEYLNTNYVRNGVLKFYKIKGEENE